MAFVWQIAEFSDLENMTRDMKTINFIISTIKSTLKCHNITTTPKPTLQCTLRPSSKEQNLISQLGRKKTYNDSTFIAPHLIAIPMTTAAATTAAVTNVPYQSLTLIAACKSTPSSLHHRNTAYPSSPPYPPARRRRRNVFSSWPLMIRRKCTLKLLRKMTTTTILSSAPHCHPTVNALLSRTGRN
jgi:hypothetical protein